MRQLKERLDYWRWVIRDHWPEAAVTVVFVLQLVAVMSVVYVAIHFIRKFW